MSGYTRIDSIDGAWGRLTSFHPSSYLYVDANRDLCFSFDEATGTVTRINTTLEQRRNQTGNKSGTFPGGIRGEGMFISKNEAALAKTNNVGIEYRNNSPIFDPYSHLNVVLQRILLSRRDNFNEADQHIADSPELVEKFKIKPKNPVNGVTKEDVAAWRKDKSYLWHEKKDLRTLQLLDAILNQKNAHLGAIGEIKACLELQRKEKTRWIH